MKPFFRYFGSKYKLAKHYGPPRRPLVIEPFAGAAGYSTYWNADKVILVEKDARTAAVWRWLINCEYDEMMALDADADDMRAADYPLHVKDFIGSWFGRGNHGRPNKALPPANRENMANGNSGRFWSAHTRNRIAAQLPRIRNWEIIEGDYADAPDVEAHWHIDPPYVVEGGQYPCGSRQLDYAEIADWCKSRRGSGEVCESNGADWLPFRMLKRHVAQTNKRYNEVVYRLDPPGHPLLSRRP